MARLLPRWLALAAVAVTAFAPPLHAEGFGDPKKGEQLFFEHSFGANAASVPLKVFEAMQDLFPRFSREELTKHYGLLLRPGRELPIGFVSSPALGVDRLSFNCSLCHTGQIDGKLVPGLPNVNLRMQRFQEDMVAAIESPRFTSDAVLARIQARHPHLSCGEALQIRLWILGAKWQAPSQKPLPYRAGPGRFDLMGAFKQRLGLPMHHFNAFMDIPALFGTRDLKRYPRDGAIGGNQDLVRYLIVRISGDNAPLVHGEVPQWVHDLNAYLFSLDPPRYPYPIDRAKAAAGRKVFNQTCAGCHGTYGLFDEHHPNQIVPIGVVGTDPNRIRIWDAASIAYMKRDPILKQLDLKPGVGFVPPSLRGVWATAPYLHNGSVPTIYDVLSNPDKRPKHFWRGGYPFDPVHVGLSTIDRPADPSQFLYDTTISGNGNQGHPFGEPLTETERMQVIEYLKTI